MMSTLLVHTHTHTPTHPPAGGQAHPQRTGTHNSRSEWLLGVMLCLPILNYGQVTPTNTFPSDGRVGIGTTSPQNKLTVFSDGDATILVSGKYASGGDYDTTNFRIGVATETDQLMSGAQPGDIVIGGYTWPAGAGTNDWLTGACCEVDIWYKRLTHHFMGCNSEMMTLVCGNGHVGINVPEPLIARFEVQSGVQPGYTEAIAQFRDNNNTPRLHVAQRRVMIGTNSGSAGGDLIIHAEEGEGVGLDLITDDDDGWTTQLRLRNTTNSGYHLITDNRTTGWMEIYAGYNAPSEVGLKVHSKTLFGPTAPTGSLSGYKVAVDGDFVAKRLIVSNSNEVPDGAYDDFRAAVDGDLIAKRVVVQITDWGDEVLEEGYKLMSLAELESFIKEHGHLPGVPSESEVLEGGNDLGAMDAMLLRKIEELTLYVIQLKKENEEIRAHFDEMNR